MTDQPIITRRSFTQKSLLAAATFGASEFTLNSQAHADNAAKSKTPGYTLGLDSPTRRFDGKSCWCHPRAGIVPGAGQGDDPAVVMTLNTLDLSGSDVFKALYGMRTDDLGKTWTKPHELDTMAVRYEEIKGERRPVAVSDYWPLWHAKSKTLLGTGHTVVYTPQWKVTHSRPRHVVYSAYDAGKSAWRPWQKMNMPDSGGKFHDVGAGSTQRVDLEDGTILLPVYFRPPESNSKVTIAKCTFDGSELKYLEHGDEIARADKTRGLHEPSLAHFQGRFFLTLRNDLRGYITSSKDGLHFDSYKEWTFDDGKPLGNYNTQQHWVTHSDGLFLVYTRRGAKNDHVFRHRAPLFMAQVDPERLVVMRDTEQILVPERGARLGNFGVVDVTPDETWVTVSEWMQPRGVEKYGSDGSLYIARIQWQEPNKLFAV